MALTPQSLPALYGGVSQQAAVSRNPTQCEEALNCDFSVERGVGKRPPLSVISQISSTDLSNAFVHWMRVRNGRWVIIVVKGDGSYQLYDAINGQLLNTENDSSQTYLTCVGNAREQFFAVSINSTVYISNREITPSMTGDTAAGSITGTAQTLQDDSLDAAPNGQIWEIIGDSNNDFDTYYAKTTNGKWFEWIKPGISYKLDAATMPHTFSLIIDAVDAFGLKGDFSSVVWDERQVGDNDSNKAPSFVGSPITSMFFKSDRLGLISGQSFNSSQVGEYHNPWRTTVTDVLDDDRIDETVNSYAVSDLYFAESVSKSLVLFANEKQFSVDGEVFSPNHLSINPITSYPTSPNVRPVASGSTVYFNADAGEHSQLREMFIQSDTVTMDAANVSSHVPEYLPSQVSAMEAHGTLDHLLMASPSAPAALYSYQYMWQGDQKALSAWGKWELAGNVNVLSMRAIGAEMFALCSYNSESFGDGAFLGKFDLKRGDNTPGFKHKIYLDQLQNVTPTYNDVEDRTYFSCLFPIMDEGFDVHLLRGDGWSAKGTYERPSAGITTFTKVSNKQFYLTGDWTGTGVEQWWVGLPYTMLFRFSEQFPYKDGKPMLGARLQIRNMTVHFEDTGFFRVDIKIRGHELIQSEVVPSLTSNYTSRTVGDEYFRLNQAPLVTGTYQFPVLSRASDVVIELVNDSPLPSTFQSAEWKGLISTRTPR